MSNKVFYFPTEVTIDGVFYEGSGRIKADAKRRAAQSAVDALLGLQATNPVPVEPPVTAISAAVVQATADNEFANLIRT